MAHNDLSVGEIISLILFVGVAIAMLITYNLVHVVILDGSRSPETQTALFRYTLPDGAVITHKDIRDGHAYYNITDKDMVFYRLFYETPGKNSKRSAHVGTGTIIKPHTYFEVSLSSTKPEHFFTKPPMSATFKVYSRNTTSSSLPIIDFLDKLPDYGLEYRQGQYGDGYIYPYPRSYFY